MYELHDAFFYDISSTWLEGEEDFYRNEALKAGSPVLELGCGTGRITLPIACAGVEIAGLDFSNDMLKIAREKASRLDNESRDRIRLVQGDMRSFNLNKKFRLIIIPFRAFLHLMTGEEQRQALQCVHRHLEDDGKLIFNIFDPKLEFIVSHLGPAGSCQVKMGEFSHPDSGNRVIMWSVREFYPESQTLKEERIFEEINEEGRAISRIHGPFKLRWIYRFEMEYLLELCRFKVESLFGGFRGEPFKYGGEQVWVVKKAAE